MGAVAVERWSRRASVGRRGAVLVVELCASAALSQAIPPGVTVRLNLEAGEHPNLVPQPLPYPHVDATAFVTPTAFVPAWRRRTTATSPGHRRPPRSRRVTSSCSSSPTGLPRRWNGARLRTARHAGLQPRAAPPLLGVHAKALSLPVFYNAAVIDVPTLRDVRLLGVRYVVTPTGIPVPLDGRVVDRAQGHDLVEVDGWQPRASVVPNFRVVPSVTAALRTVLTPRSIPAGSPCSRAIRIEPTPDATPGAATYTERDPEHVRLSVRATAPSVAVIRTTYDDGWTATVDGETATPLPVDGFLQGGTRAER